MRFGSSASPLKGSSEPWTAPWFGLIYGIGAQLKNDEVLWFFTCLFSTAVLFWFLWRVKPARAAVGLTIVLAMFGPAIYRLLGFRLPWNLDGAMVAVGFYGLGFVGRERLQNALTVHPGIKLCLLGALAAAVAWAARMNGLADLNALELGYLPWFYVGALAGIAGVVVAGSLAEKPRGHGYLRKRGRHLPVALARVQCLDRCRRSGLPF